MPLARSASTAVIGVDGLAVREEVAERRVDPAVAPTGRSPRPRGARRRRPWRRPRASSSRGPTAPPRGSGAGRVVPPGRRTTSSAARATPEPPSRLAEPRAADATPARRRPTVENACGFARSQVGDREIPCHSGPEQRFPMWKAMWTSVDERALTRRRAPPKGPDALRVRPSPRVSSRPSSPRRRTSTVRTGSTSWNSLTRTSWVPTDRIGSSRWTSLRSTGTPACAATASAMSAAVTEPKSLPSSPARASIRSGPAAMSLRGDGLVLALLLRELREACARLSALGLLARRPSPP